MTEEIGGQVETKRPNPKERSLGSFLAGRAVSVLAGRQKDQYYRAPDGSIHRRAEV